MKLIDLTGRRYTRLLVLNRSPFQSSPIHAEWLCRCDCGNETLVRGQHLRSGNTKSCGCLHVERAGLLNNTHDASTTRLAKIWYGMRKRCNPITGHRRWGGRGITICEEWQTFEPFRVWALTNGYRDDLTIDRIDNDGNYEPSNCHWITHSENRSKGAK
jgi:hypothetical protein